MDGQPVLQNRWLTMKIWPIPNTTGDPKTDNRQTADSNMTISDDMNDLAEAKGGLDLLQCNSENVGL